jgi:hypothetical protein
VEGGDPHALRVLTDELDDAPSHFIGRLVGERDRHDLKGACVTRSEDVGDPSREYSRLARASARDHEQGSPALEDRFALGFGQALKQRRGVERA